MVYLRRALQMPVEQFFGLPKREPNVVRTSAPLEVARVLLVAVAVQLNRIATNAVDTQTQSEFICVTLRAQNRDVLRIGREQGLARLIADVVGVLATIAGAGAYQALRTGFGDRVHQTGASNRRQVGGLATS